MQAEEACVWNIFDVFVQNIMLASEFEIVDRFLEENIASLIFARLVLLCQRRGDVGNGDTQ